MEIFSEIWAWIIAGVSSISFNAIFLAIGLGIIRGSANKVASKFNVEKISEKATEKGVSKLKEMTFNHSIQPIVESKLRVISEEANGIVKKELEETQKRYDKLINVIEKLASYFDNSIGVPEEKKAELKQAVLEAKNEPTSVSSVVIEQVVETKAEAVIEPVKKPKKVNRTSVER